MNSIATVLVVFGLVHAATGIRCYNGKVGGDAQFGGNGICQTNSANDLKDEDCVITDDICRFCVVTRAYSVDINATDLNERNETIDMYRWCVCDIEDICYTTYECKEMTDIIKSVNSVDGSVDVFCCDDGDNCNAEYRGDGNGYINGDYCKDGKCNKAASVLHTSGVLMLVTGYLAVLDISGWLA